MKMRYRHKYTKPTTGGNCKGRYYVKRRETFKRHAAAGGGFFEVVHLWKLPSSKYYPKKTYSDKVKEAAAKMGFKL